MPTRSIDMEARFFFQGDCSMLEHLSCPACSLCINQIKLSQCNPSTFGAYAKWNHVCNKALHWIEAGDTEKLNTDVPYGDITKR